MSEPVGNDEMKSFRVKIEATVELDYLIMAENKKSAIMEAENKAIAGNPPEEITILERGKKKPEVEVVPD